jgi:hypothetical protein
MVVWAWAFGAAPRSDTGRRLHALAQVVGRVDRAGRTARRHAGVAGAIAEAYAQPAAPRAMKFIAPSRGHRGMPAYWRPQAPRTGQKRQHPAIHFDISALDSRGPTR